MNRKEIIETLGYWVKSLTYAENDDRTDADLTFMVTGMADSPIKNEIKESEVTEEIVRELAEAVAERFCDAHTVEELDWNVAPMTHRRGVSDWALTVYAGVHLAYNDYEDEEKEDEDDPRDEEGEEMARQQEEKEGQEAQRALVLP
jgi:hypothetical protein